MAGVFKFILALAMVWVTVSALREEPHLLNNIHGCYWDGTAPICKGECREGWTKNATDMCGDGHCCNSGQKVYCCPAIETPADCYWAGTATICEGGCSIVGYEVVMEDRCGDGHCCDFGRKVLCCRRGS